MSIRMQSFLIIFTVLAMIALVGTQAFAQSTKLVKVDGMVCDFCAQSLNFIFEKQAEVENINVDLNTKIVTVNFKDGQSLSDEKIKELIADAGYDVSEITAQP